MSAAAVEAARLANVGNGWDEAVLAVWRGFRNAVYTGTRIRRPYLINAGTNALIFGQGDFKSNVTFVGKQLLLHGRNLALFVAIYKAITILLRRMGLRNGLDSWIAGFIGGYIALGDSEGVSGSVNNQIVMYLFARGVVGLAKGAANRGLIPVPDNSSRLFAGFSLALALYLTEYEPETLRKGFMKTMTFVYHDSDYGSALPTLAMAPFVLLGLFAQLRFIFPSISKWPLMITLGIDK